VKQQQSQNRHDNLQDNDMPHSQDKTTNRRGFLYAQSSAPYIFIAPFLATFLAFGLYPILKSLILAFYITSGPKSTAFAGFDNFRFLWHDRDFWVAVRNTIIFAFCSIFIQLPISFALAVGLNGFAGAVKNKKVRNSLYNMRNIFRFAFFSPQLVGMVFVGILFSLIFAPRFGILNVFLNSWFDVPIDTQWLSNPALVMPAIVLTAMWLYAGLNMVYFLAGIESVPDQLYEAARVDGCGFFRETWHVTLPSIKPILTFVVLLSVIGSFQLFELPYLMLNNSPGPDNSGLFIVSYLYINGFITGDLGYASTIGWVLVIILMIGTLVIPAALAAIVAVATARTKTGKSVAQAVKGVLRTVTPATDAV